MYMSHALVVRRDLFLRLGGFRAGFEGSQDHDFALLRRKTQERLLKRVALPGLRLVR